jgi:hypothetical protein
MGRLRAGEFCWTVANLPSLCPHPTWHPRGPAYVERGVELTDLGSGSGSGSIGCMCKFCTECCFDGS